MSDPVTNVQIEDVLSSIRKLVSEEVRSQTKTRSGADNDSDGEAPKDMLVLTSAHRVPDDLDAEAEDYAGDRSDTDERDPFEDGAPGQGASDFDVDAFSRTYLADEDEEAVANDNAAAEDTDTGDAAADDTGTDDILGDLDALLGTSDRDEQGFEDEGEIAAAPMAVDAADSIEVEEARAREDDAEPDLSRDPSAIPSFLRSRGISTLDQRLADLEGTGTAEDGRPEAAGQPESGVAEEDEATILWQDHVAEPVADELDIPADDPEEEIDGSEAWAPEVDDGAALLADEPQTIDEDMLRDLVSEIVREELQGALGERITRNVRKLVRREIQRALAAHDLL